MLGVVIPVRNGWEDTKECLESLYKSRFPIRVILVDGGSTDRTWMAHNVFEKLEIIRATWRLDFSTAVNLGCERAFSYPDIDKVLILNNDTRVLGYALEFMEGQFDAYHKVGIVTPRINYYNSEVIWSAGGALNLNWGLTWHRNIRTLLPDLSNFADWATGCAMMVSKKCWEDVGVFDENLPWYDSDVDFSIRAKAKGWTIWYTSKAWIEHKIGRSSTNWWKVKEKMRGRYLLLKKHVSFWRLPLALVGFLVQSFFRFIGSKLR